MRTFRFLVVILVAAGTVYAYNPPSGGEEWYEFVSPSFLGSGLDLTRTDAILGDAANPAVAGLKEQPTATLYYGSIIDPGSTDLDKFGHIVSGSAHIPTSFGVLGANGLFLNAGLEGMNLGTLGRLRVSYARDILPKLLIGAAGNVMFGEQENFAVGMSADVGIVHLPGRLLGMDDFRWAITGSTLGIGFRPHDVDEDGDDVTGFPSIFTPGLGFSGVPWRDATKDLRFGAWLQTPRLQNVRTGGRVEIVFDKFVTVGVGMRYDLRQRTDSTADYERSLVPSVGVEVNISRLLDRRVEGGQISEPPETPAVRDGDIRTAFSVAPLAGDLFAVGVGVEVPFGKVDREAPAISTGEVASRWISPNNDGINDDIVVPIAIIDESPIEGYAFIVRDASDTPVRRIENKDPRPELEFDALVAEIREGEQGIQVPDVIRWNGRDDTGSLLSDGQYTYAIEAWDVNGNRGFGGEGSVAIDNQAPQITVQISGNRIFSPNGDGNQDVLTIEQSGSEEINTVGTIVDTNGTTVRTLTYNDASPERFSWDGTDDQGDDVVDGAYRYRITSVDRAGNQTSAEIAGIILNRETQSVFVTTDNHAFSPDGDGTLDTVEFTLLFPDPNGLIEWEFSIVDVEDGRTLRTYVGEESGQQRIRWNGTDEAGERFDGTYRGTVSALYQNGGNPSSASRAVLLDTSDPVVEIDVRPQPFSPDNDGYADELFIDLAIDDLSGADTWELNILNPRGGVFRSYSGHGNPASRITWGGYSDGGELVEAAEDYPWEFSVTDRVGNTTRREGEIPIDVLVIREGDRLKIRISNITFAPNSPEFLAADEAVLEKNFEIVNRIAEILDRYRSYGVRIEGHAVNLSGTQREQDEELIPLSRARAETVLRALVERGLNEDRFTAVGIGGAEPIVPHTDLENRWRNRRVEFVLIR